MILNIYKTQPSMLEIVRQYIILKILANIRIFILNYSHESLCLIAISLIGLRIYLSVGHT